MLRILIEHSEGGVCRQWATETVKKRAAYGWGGSMDVEREGGRRREGGGGRRREEGGGEG